LKNAIIAVNTDVEIAPYRQIVEQIRGLIQRGDLGPATVLPTVRQLADDLNVAPNTVARAYTDLQNDGWLVSEGRRGTHVAPSLPDVDKRARKQTLRDSVEHFVTTLVGRGYSRAEILDELSGSLRIAR
jgi:GntR family transcriptional regulator